MGEPGPEFKFELNADAPDSIQIIHFWPMQEMMDSIVDLGGLAFTGYP